MTDPRIDVILEHLSLVMVCKFYKEDSCGTWCERAYQNKKYDGTYKFVKCRGMLNQCELTKDDEIIKE